MRALILSARVGGHWTAAHAIAEELRDTLPPRAEINVVDVFDRPYARPAFARFAHGYELFVRLFPLLCSLAFVLTNGRRQVKFFGAFSRLLFNRDAVRTLLYPERPDLIISDALNFGQLALVARGLLGERATSTRFVVAITDPVTVHYLWWTDAADWYLVGTDVAARQCTETFGINPDVVRMVGLPVRAAFRERRSKREARVALGLDPEGFTVLFMGGTSGAGAMEKLVDAVETAELPIQNIAITGKNETLRRQLAERFGGRVHVLGFTNNVHEYMQAADLLVTKAGPGTVAEGLVSGVPVCISGHLPWTEQGNTDYYVKLGRVLHVGTPDDLVARLRDILAGTDVAFTRLDRRAWETPSADSRGVIGRELRSRPPDADGAARRLSPGKYAGRGITVT